MRAGGSRYSAAPESAQKKLAAKPFSFNDLFDQGRRPARGFRGFLRPADGGVNPIKLRSAPLVLALKHKHRYDGEMCEMVTAGLLLASARRGKAGVSVARQSRDPRGEARLGSRL